MAARNSLSEAPPYAVESALRQLGNDLRTARLRRNFTLDDVAAKIGAGRRAVSDAEHGKPTTTVATYAALLWAYGLLKDLSDLADPVRDVEGATLARSKERARARTPGALDNDF